MLVSIRVKTELRKIDGQRIARFTLLDDVELDSQMYVRIAKVVQQCGIVESNFYGMFNRINKTVTGSDTVMLGGVDIPVSAIQTLTGALNEQGIQVV